MKHHSQLNPNIAAVVTCIGLLSSNTTLAAADPSQNTWYEVSVAIFKHVNSATGNERWPNPDELELSFPSGIVQLDPADNDNAVAATALNQLVAFRESAATDEEFQQALASIKLSSNYQLMTSKTWQQPALEKDHAIPVLVQAGNEFDGYYELEGSIELAVSRYLHIKANLWLADYIQQVETATPWWQGDGLLDENANDQSTSYEPRQYGKYSATETITRYESIRTVVLDESRRMRSGELHYLDNPLFGMIVKVTPIEFAEEGESEETVEGSEAINTVSAP